MALTNDGCDSASNHIYATTSFSTLDMKKVCPLSVALSLRFEKGTTISAHQMP